MKRKESLIINNVGAVKHAQLDEIKRVNVFIGESGSGKSTVMKVLAMCRWLYKMQCVRSYLKISGIKNSPFRLRAERILSENGLSSLMKSTSSISYKCDDFECNITANRLGMPSTVLPASQLSLEKIAYISDKRVLLPDLMSGNVLIKHGMSYLDETFNNFQKALNSIHSTVLPYLGIKMDVKKTSVGPRIFVSSNMESDVFDNLPLNSASSGVQSSVGIHYILNYFANHYDLVDAMNRTILSYLANNDSFSKFKASTDIGAFPNRRITLLIEEPELSLFPANQRGLVNYMVDLALSSASTIDLIFATHSPYILTALNVLMLAGKARVINADATADIIKGVKTLPIEDITAWEVKGGHVRTLIDEETGLIDGAWLDSVSEFFDEQIFQLNKIVYG